MGVCLRRFDCIRAVHQRRQLEGEQDVEAGETDDQRDRQCALVDINVQFGLKFAQLLLKFEQPIGRKNDLHPVHLTVDAQLLFHFLQIQVEIPKAQKADLC